MPEESILEKLPLPKLKSFFEAGKNRYWIEDSQEKWSPRIAGDVKIELEKLGYNAKASKGKAYSEADYEMADIRNHNGVIFAGPVAGKKKGVYEAAGDKYLVTVSPQLIEPVCGNWENIEKLGLRLFGREQFDYVLGWTQTAVITLYREANLKGQLLALAGPAGCGKSFWQNQVITPVLGGRVAKPMQYMSGGTTFNEDIIRSEHLMLEDENSKTDIRSRRAFGSAIKEFTVNRTQRAHGKGKDAISLESKHWVSLSVNDEAENLSILPPMDDSLLDKIMLIRCDLAINAEWPGAGRNAELEKLVKDEIPAFIHYLLEDHKIQVKTDQRFGVAAYHNPELMSRLDRLSPEDGLDCIIDKNWAKLCEEKGVLKMPAEDIETCLQNNDSLNYRAKRILTWDGACAVYLERLSRKYPGKYIKPKPSQRPRTWTITWA